MGIWWPVMSYNSCILNKNFVHSPYIAHSIDDVNILIKLPMANFKVFKIYLDLKYLI